MLWRASRITDIDKTVILVFNAATPAAHGACWRIGFTKENNMRNMFFGLIAFVFSAVAVAGEEQSVLVSDGNQAAAVVVSNDCACADVVAATCADCNCATPATRRGRLRYRVVTESCDACTGSTARTVTRGVVRGTGTVVRGAGTAVYNIVTLPARVCRNGRCN